MTRSHSERDRLVTAGERGRAKRLPDNRPAHEPRRLGRILAGPVLIRPGPDARLDRRDTARRARPDAREGLQRKEEKNDQRGRDVGLRAREAAARPGTARAFLVAEFERLYGRPARFSHRRWGPALDRALRRLDRYADAGRGRQGAGLDLALELMAPTGMNDEPVSLSYFVPVLDEISKDWRRAHKPQIKAERRRRRAARATAAQEAIAA